MAQVELIRFFRPESSEHCLFVSNLPADLSRDKKWAQLNTAFSRFGLLHQVQLPESEDLNYAFVKFYSPYSVRCAQQVLDRQLVIGGSFLRVHHGRERLPRGPERLYISHCHELANHYLGFNGWSIHVQTIDKLSEGEYRCEAVLRVGVWGVESVGRGRVTLDPDNTDIKSLGIAKKQVFNRACEDAFSHLVLAVVQPGERLAAVTVATDTQGEHEEQITCPKVNILPEGVYEYTREHE